MSKKSLWLRNLLVQNVNDRHVFLNFIFLLVIGGGWYRDLLHYCVFSDIYKYVPQTPCEAVSFLQRGNDNMRVWTRGEVQFNTII